MNIVLIGMPGCGKSTVGVLLAKSLLMHFVDTDLTIQSIYKKSLSAIIEEEGLDAFKRIENDVLAATDEENAVIATGGSAVYGDEAMEHLGRDGTIVHLDVSLPTIKSRLSDIKTRGVAIADGLTIDDLYAERAPLYEKYANVTVNCDDKTAEECVDAIVAALKL
jgi:shikimate kinase